MNFFNSMPWRVRANIEPGVLEAVTSSGLFDPAWYVHRYPDVVRFPRGPLVHFCMYGLKELRDPSPYVSPANYLRRYPDARNSPLPAFLHALTTLPLEDRQEAWMPDDDMSLAYLVAQLGLFDEQWYVDRYRDVGPSSFRPLLHFIRHGASEVRDPGPAFDSAFYRDSHPDYQERFRSPIEHFVRLGRARGYPATGRPKYERWLSAFDELTQEDVDRIRADILLTAQPISAVHVLDIEACADINRIIQSWDAQIGGDLRVSFVQSADVAADAWKRCAARFEGHPNMSVASEGEELAALVAGTVVLLCAGASLARPHAAYVLAQTLAESGADAAYADHDHIDDAGIRTAPVFKPAMSPVFMRQLPYAGAVVATVLHDRNRANLAAALAAAVKGDAQKAWASYLLGLPPDNVVRAPFLLFHRPHREAFAMPVYEPVPNGRLNLSDVPPDECRTSVTIIIPTRDHSELLRDCIDSITTETDYPPALVEINVVDNGSEEEATLSYFAELDATPGVKVVASPGAFNFSKICNDGAARANGEILVFLNNDMTVKQRDWLRKLVTHARRPETGVVGARLLYPDATTQHGGVVLGVQGVGAHRLAGMDSERADAIDITREMVSVTGACLAVRRNVFEELGGFDPILRVAFNDVMLCAKAYEAGYRNIYVGEPLLYHHESKSRGLDDSRHKQHRNTREAIRVRERWGALFRDDPTYSPNLSLQAIGSLATPPRVVRPWRRSASSKRSVLLLSRVHSLGSGVATVLEQQAMFLRNRGWDVVVGGPMRERDIDYVGCRRVNLWTEEVAAAFAVAEGVDCVIAHTPPFFSMTRYLGAQPLMYFVDHGEPTPRLFPDWQQREDIDWEKRFCAPLAQRVFTISETIFKHQYRKDAVVVRNGNSHLATWSEDWASKRPALRKKLGFDGHFVVLNVCRFGPGERFYKGIGRYGEVASDTPYRHPELGGRLLFVLAGRGDKEDVAEVEAMGLTAYANISDADLTDLYVASDLYLNLSEWEGYNLGIGQALAMGLDVIASDIEAHREFDVERSNSVPETCDALARRFATWREDAADRRPLVQSWDIPLTRLAQIIEDDLGEAEARWVQAPGAGNAT